MIALLAAATWAGVIRGAPPPDDLDRAYGSRRVALVVGIDGYDDPALGNLRFAAKDATDLAAVLSDAERGGYDVVSTVAGTVTREAFWSAMRAVGAGVQRDDTVVVYVAAHGTLDLGAGGTELFLLSSDAWLADAASTGIAVADLARAIEALPARRKVLVLDSCYSATGRGALPEVVRRRVEGLRGPIPAPPALQVSAFSAHLYAAHVNQPAIEDPTLENGVYTHFLLDALRGAGDRDGDGLVEVMEAHAWARDRTLAHTGGAQVPWASTVSVGRESVFLTGDPAHRRAAEHAILTGLEGLPLGAEVRIDGLPRGAGPLQDGVRRVEVVAGDRVLISGRRTVGPGDRVSLDRWAAARSARREWTIGAAVGPDREWLGTTSAVARFDLVPRDPGGVRPVLGARLHLGPGAGVASLAGSAELTGGPAWNVGTTRLGPVVGAGVVWRSGAAGGQGSPLFTPGASASFDGGPLVFVLDGNVALFLADGGVVASPRAALSTGFSF